MYLTLQTKHLLSDSALQTLIDNLLDISNASNSLIASKIVELGLNIPQNFFQDNNFFQRFHNNSNGKMRTSFCRKKYFKENFNYIEPVCMYFESDNDKKGPKMYYVPIHETIRGLMKNSFVYKHWENNTNCLNANDNILSDITDGKNYKNSQFFKENPLALRIILYQDSFELCNPLGSSKKIHKVIGIYMILANIPAYSRCRVDHIQLVGLCLERDCKKYGFSECFKLIMNDLHTLETEGITLNDKTKKIKGTVVAMAGDNLGNHQIGGYIENFSNNEYFCRYCHITKTDFDNNKFHGFPLRTESSYQDDVDLCNVTGKPSRGIHDNSVLNRLNYFHVCTPGLPPCAAHDLFEGVVQYDVMIMVEYFVAKKVFSYDFINTRLQNVRFINESDISLSQIAYLRYLLIDYVELRNCFRKDFVYSAQLYLFIRFGPLRQLWTLRFESKHRYFKNIVRHSPNFKNILFTLSERHQLLQAMLLSHDSTFTDSVTCDTVTVFKSSDYPNNMSKIVEQQCIFNEPFISESAIFRGVRYQKGMFVCYGQNDNGYFCLCEIMYLLIRCSIYDTNT
ncbi:hypothetical protein RN001_005706 [Aquatica leii]|uniref:Uncharacterized protein n=1 Tax=Aquatica leii TaxID=1421715 RepID=A0AAN7PC82_9COLE|nr:hypothetical protein RN001_005706 [Aquatica leii]